MQIRLRHIFIATAVIAMVLAFAPLLFPMHSKVRKFVFYDEQYNAVNKRLNAIEGLQVRDSWQHEDLYMEDCGFDITIGNQNASLTFVDHQDWVALFSKIDGIRISMQGQQRLITREQLIYAGIEIEGLADVLENLKSVTNYCSSQTELTIVPDTDYDHWKNLNYVNIKFK